MTEFIAWQKTARWNREVQLTEKIDGTNACIIVDDSQDDEYRIFTQSRKRLITPGKTTDNYGFAQWVQENAEELVELLGPGRHYGEWYGKGIQRGYGLDHKRFALFDIKNFGTAGLEPSEAHPYQIHPTLPVDVVPSLGFLPYPDDESIEGAVEWLRLFGSAIVPDFDRPEGAVLLHTAANIRFKILIENDDIPKGLAA